MDMLPLQMNQQIKFRIVIFEQENRKFPFMGN